MRQQSLAGTALGWSVESVNFRLGNRVTEIKKQLQKGNFSSKSNKVLGWRRWTDCRLASSNGRTSGILFCIFNRLYNSSK